MTGITIIRDGGVRSRERIKTIVVEVSRNPGRFAVAAGAVRGKLLRDVVGVGCLVVIADMASHAGIRGVIVVPVMASGAVIGYDGMRAVQGVIIVVNRESGRRPTGIRGICLLYTSRCV